MPRRPRIVVPEVALHVVQRGNNRGQCFFNEDDYRAYLRYLADFAPRTRCAVHAYCLMPNHVHLLVTPRAAEACSELMKRVGQSYVQRLNKMTGRKGTLWEGRFYSCPVGSDFYALACYRYIELNPATAGIVPHPAHYRWSSFAANADGREDGIVEAHPSYAALGEDPVRRRAAYRSLFDASLPPEIVDDIRLATRGGHLVGARRPRGRPRRMGSDPITSRKGV